MSKASEEYARTQTARMLATIMVYNPTSEDVVFWTDKYGTQAAKTMVPKAQKDIGFGKGKMEMPRYKAERYTEDMITKLINKYSDAKWAKDKQVYRTRDEVLQHAESEQIRTNDATLWAEWFPKIWLGKVRDFGYQELPDPIDERPVDTGSAMGDVLKKTGLADREYVPDIEK